MLNPPDLHLGQVLEMMGGALSEERNSLSRGDAYFILVYEISHMLLLLIIWLGIFTDTDIFFSSHFPARDSRR